MSLAWVKDSFCFEAENDISWMVKWWGLSTNTEKRGLLQLLLQDTYKSDFTTMFSWKLAHTMQLVSHNSFQIPSVVYYFFFGLSMLLKTNRMKQIAPLKAEMSVSTAVSSISLLVCLSAAKFLNTVFHCSNAFSIPWRFRKITVWVVKGPCFVAFLRLLFGILHCQAI